MAARFPQGTSSLGYQLSSTYSSKIKALYWAASADSVHRLRPGDSSTTIVTRATSGAAFDSTNGRITGSSWDGTTYFTDTAASGSYFSAANADMVIGCGIFGDVFGGTPTLGSRSTHAIISGGAYGQITSNTFPTMKATGFNAVVTGASAGTQFDTALTGFGDDVAALNTYAYRFLSSDATAKNRLWKDGSELTGARLNNSPAGTTSWGDTTNPITFGASFNNGAADKQLAWEFAFVGDGTLTDADLAAITADPTVLIQVASSGTSLTPGVGSLTLSGPAPTIVQGRNIAPGAGTIALSSTAPTVVQAFNFIPGAAVVTLAGPAPVVAQGSPGTITSAPLKNNTGTLLASTLVDKVAAYKLADMNLAASWSAQTTNGSGVLALTAGGLVAGTTYLLVLSSTDGSAVGVKAYTAA